LDRIRPSINTTFGAQEVGVVQDTMIRKGVLHKVNQKRKQRKLKTFELAKTAEGFVEIRCFEAPSAKRASAVVDGKHPTVVWQLNWTSTEAMAITITSRGDRSGDIKSNRKGSSRSSIARAKQAEGATWSFSVAGLLNSKNQKQEQLSLEASTQEDAAHWVDAITTTMQQSMAREFGREVICGLKVLRIHMDGASMEVSASAMNLTTLPRWIGNETNELCSASKLINNYFTTKCPPTQSFPFFLCSFKCRRSHHPSFGHYLTTKSMMKSHPANLRSSSVTLCAYSGKHGRGNRRS
jgi:hypothetical protein